jgi:hypothetical protein
MAQSLSDFGSRVEGVGYIKVDVADGEVGLGLLDPVHEEGLRCKV